MILKLLKGKYFRSLVAAISTILLVITSISILPHFAKSPQGHKVAAATTDSTLSAILKTEPDPTPEPSPSPSPVLTGYCLNVPILMYHHIQPMEQAKQKNQASLTVETGTFDNQMAYLISHGYTTISLDQLVGALLHHQGLPGKNIVITLDDGYQDAYTNAFGIIQKYHITVNLFIPTGLMDNPDYLRWDQLKQMVNSGQTFAYDHTYSHANLGAVSGDKLQFEVMNAKKQLEEKLGKPVNIFAYPYGSETDSVINFLRSNGFIAAASTIPGMVQCDSIIMSLHRTRIGGSTLSAYGL